MAEHWSWPFSTLVLTGTLAFHDSRESLKGFCQISCLTGEFPGPVGISARCPHPGCEAYWWPGDTIFTT